MTGRRLVLSDGTEIENGEAGYSGGFLWLYIPGMTMMQAATVLFNPEKTVQITFQYGEMEDVYNGYTNCINLNIDTDGKVSACMTRGAENGV